MKKLISVISISLFSLGLSAQKSINYKTAEEKLNEKYCSGLFKTTDGKILDVADNTSAKSYPNILDWLEGRVPGLKIYNTRTGIRVPLIRGNVPGIYVDEIQVNASYLNSLSINDIAIVKVINTPFLGGFNGGGGAIAIYTFRGEEEEEETDSK